MTPSEPAIIKAALILAGVSQVDVARHCRVKRQVVNQVIHGRSRSKKIETFISIATHTACDKLWPQWYGPNSTRRRKRLSASEVTARFDAFRATQEAA